MTLFSHQLGYKYDRGWGLVNWLQNSLGHIFSNYIRFKIGKAVQGKFRGTQTLLAAYKCVYLTNVIVSLQTFIFLIFISLTHEQTHRTKNDLGGNDRADFQYEGWDVYAIRCYHNT